MRLTRFLKTLLLTASIITAPLTAAHAEQYLTIGAGWFDFSRSEDDSANFMGEWRGNTFFHGFRPVIGAQINTNGGAYGYAGLDYDWEFAPHWVATPGLAIGAWRNGNSIDLGGTFEFHESLELAYKFDNDYRLGAQISHTSNADIYTHNPGANTIMGTFSIPLTY